MNLKLTWLLTLTMAFSIQFSNAQEKTISGAVTSSTDGLPLPGVNVIVQGTTRGVQTDFDGKYSIKAASGEVLVFSFVGMKDKQVAVGASNSINVSLDEDVAALDEVIVTAYGTTTKVKSTSALSTVTAESLESVPIASFEQVLQGRAPGLLVASGSGQPGTVAKVRIRGTSSINGNNTPLYVVDGVPISEATFAALNPNDFESVSILKDAQASSLYGSRAGAGVIVISTKSGNYDSKTSVTYRSQLGFSDVTKPRFEVLDAKQHYEYNRILGNNNLTDAEIAARVAQTDTKWDDFIFRTGTTQNHELSIQGGSDKTTFFTSLAYYDQQGVIITSDLKRFTTRFNFEHKVSDKFSFGMNNTLAFAKSNFINSENGVNLNNVALYSYIGNPTQSLFNDDGSYATGNGRNAANYYESQVEGINRNGDLKIISSLFSTLKFTQDLSLIYRMGVDFDDRFRVSALNPDTFVGRTITPGNKGRQFESSFRRFQFNSTLQLRYLKEFGNHTVDASGFVEYFKSHFRSSSFTGFGIEQGLFGFANSRTAGTVDNGLIPTVGGANNENGLFSVFGSLNYDFASKYGIDVSVRNDRSSRFSTTNNQATFYSVAGRWNLTKEGFLADSNTVSNLKLRASFGTSGNERSIANFSYLQTLGRTLYQGEDVLTFGGLPNVNLKWEVLEQLNVGLDYGFFDNRIDGSIDYYNKQSKDLFVTYTIPSAYGDTSVLANQGVMENKGLEFSINADVIRNDNTTLTLFGNLAYNKNKVINLGQVNEFELGTSIVRVGEPINSHYEVEWAGVNPANGEPLYRDLDGNVTNVYSAANRKTGYGSPEPIYTGGFGFEFKHKGFQISSLFSFADEYFRYNNNTFFVINPNFATAFNQLTDVLDIWENPGDITEIQAANFPTQFSSKLIEDASYLRLRNVTVSYNLPESFLKKVKYFNGVRVFVQGVNLATWTEFTGFDPEDNNNIAQFEYPTPRTITMGVDLKF